MMVVATSARAQTVCVVCGHDHGEVDGDVLDADDVYWQQMPPFPFDTAVASDVGDDMKIDAPLSAQHTDDEDDADDDER